MWGFNILRKAWHSFSWSAAFVVGPSPASPIAQDLCFKLTLLDGSILFLEIYHAGQYGPIATWTKKNGLMREKRSTGTVVGSVCKRTEWRASPVVVSTTSHCDTQQQWEFQKVALRKPNAGHAFSLFCSSALMFVLQARPLQDPTNIVGVGLLQKCNLYAPSEASQLRQADKVNSETQLQPFWTEPLWASLSHSQISWYITGSALGLRHSFSAFRRSFFGRHSAIRSVKPDTLKAHRRPQLLTSIIIIFPQKILLANSCMSLSQNVWRLPQIWFFIIVYHHFPNTNWEFAEATWSRLCRHARRWGSTNLSQQQLARHWKLKKEL